MHILIVTSAFQLEIGFELLLLDCVGEVGLRDLQYVAILAGLILDDHVLLVVDYDSVFIAHADLRVIATACAV